MKTAGIVFALILASFCVASAQEPKQIIDLRGTWKFEIGDNAAYADPKFNDAKWEEIFVPEKWENEGHPGYDGYAWYRKRFSLPLSVQGKDVYFHGGYIDDACTIYVNGHCIGGKGKMPPHFETAYDQEEIFVVPEAYVKFNQDNVVSIRVYDDRKDGGITRGKIGIYAHPDDMHTAVSLPRLWKFKTGDDQRWSDPAMDDSKWGDVIVPEAWEHQGYEEYDGFAWYRTDVTIQSSLQNEQLYIVLGKIDDDDEAYFNGARIGATGRMGGTHWKSDFDDEYQIVRVYKIPSALIKADQKNVLALRVYDRKGYGGVWEGPIGIITASEYKRMDLYDIHAYRKHKNSFNSFSNGWDSVGRIVGNIFDAIFN